MESRATFGTAQYLTFTLGGDVLALDIARVREVIDVSTPVRIPRAPHYVRGVIDLRGQTITILDLRQALAMGGLAVGDRQCVVIADVRIDGENLTVGVLVDGVEEVVRLEASDIEPPPHLGSMVETSFIRGIARKANRLVLLLEFDNVFLSAGARAVEFKNAVSIPNEAAVIA